MAILFDLWVGLFQIVHDTTIDHDGNDDGCYKREHDDADNDSFYTDDSHGTDAIDSNRS